MSTESNKAIIRRGFEEGINGQNLAIFEQLLAPTFINHSMPAPVPGPAGFLMVLGAFTAAFPDMRVTLEDVLGDGDKVATRGYFTGTHRGDFNGIPATGKTVKVGYTDIWHVENGQATENWVVMDIMGLMQQLGVIPAPAG